VSQISQPEAVGVSFSSRSIGARIKSIQNESSSGETAVTRDAMVHASTLLAPSQERMAGA
jgi:hypothetical protein